MLTYNSTTDSYIFSTAEIPLYNCNTTYVLRITAVTDDDRIITSNDVAITEDELKDYMSKGQNGKSVMVNTLETVVILHVSHIDTVYFQIGLRLTGSQASFNCQSFEVCIFIAL